MRLDALDWHRLNGHSEYAELAHGTTNISFEREGDVYSIYENDYLTLVNSWDTVDEMTAQCVLLEIVGKFQNCTSQC
jgi:hypothetical protein